MTGANLIPAARRRRQRRRAHLRAWAGVCGTYGLLLAGVCGWCLVRAGGRAQDVKAKLAETARLIEASADRQAELTAELGDVRSTLSANRALGRQPDWSALLAVLGDCRGDSVVLNSCELRPRERAAGGRGGKGRPGPDVLLGERRYRLRLSGLGRSQTSVSQFVLRLEAVGLFERVKLIRSRRRRVPGGEAVSFNIECML
jgi:hypothetical protein